MPDSLAPAAGTCVSEWTPNDAFATKKLLVALAVFVSACWTNREIHVPAGYKGWIVVRFGDKGSSCAIVIDE